MRKILYTITLSIFTLSLLLSYPLKTQAYNVSTFDPYYIAYDWSLYEGDSSMDASQREYIPRRIMFTGTFKNFPGEEACKNNHQFALFLKRTKLNVNAGGYEATSTVNPANGSGIIQNIWEIDDSSFMKDGCKNTITTMNRNWGLIFLQLYFEEDRTGPNGWLEFEGCGKTSFDNLNVSYENQGCTKKGVEKYVTQTAQVSTTWSNDSETPFSDISDIKFSDGSTLSEDIKKLLLYTKTDKETTSYTSLKKCSSQVVEESCVLIGTENDSSEGMISGAESDFVWIELNYENSYLKIDGDYVHNFKIDESNIIAPKNSSITLSIPSATVGPSTPVCSLQDILAKKSGCLTPEQQKALEESKTFDPTKNLQQFALGGISQEEAQSGVSGIQKFGLIGQNIQIGAADSARIQELEQMQESGEIIRCTPQATQDGKTFETCQEELQYLRSKTGFGAIESTLQRFVNFALGFIEILALIVLLYGAVIWITAGGNDEKVDKGRTIILWSAIGLVIVIVAHVVITVVIQVITGLGD